LEDSSKYKFTKLNLIIMKEVRLHLIESLQELTRFCSCYHTQA
jgi:hypothetical protein